MQVGKLEDSSDNNKYLINHLGSNLGSKHICRHPYIKHFVTIENFIRLWIYPPLFFHSSYDALLIGRYYEVELEGMETTWLS